MVMPPLTCVVAVPLACNWVVEMVMPEGLISIELEPHFKVIFLSEVMEIWPVTSTVRSPMTFKLSLPEIVTFRSPVTDTVSLICTVSVRLPLMVIFSS